MSVVVGILNLTPDSFSDGGQFNVLESACARALQMAEEGARVIDIGAESTRPGARPLDADQEWERLGPVLEALSYRWQMVNGPKSPTRSKPWISVDTRYAATARKALRLGVNWINDVSGGADPDLWEAVVESSADYVLMHSLSVPADRALVLEAHVDPVDHVLRWMERRLVALDARGLRRDRVIVDPGIGFGKTPHQSMKLLQHAIAFKSLGVRVLVGHSRKSFLSLFTTKPFRDRDLETIAASLFLSGQGVDYIRVHDVASHVAALQVFESLGSLALSRKDGL